MVVECGARLGPFRSMTGTVPRQHNQPNRVAMQGKQRPPQKSPASDKALFFDAEPPLRMAPSPALTRL